MTLTSHGLANRPGEPYPATFQKKTRTTQKGWALLPDVFSLTDGHGVPILRLVKWTVGESNPDFLLAKQESYRWTNSPF